MSKQAEPKKRIKILLAPEQLKNFGIKPGDTYDVQREGIGEVHHGYLIYPNKRVGAMVVYKHEAEIL